MMNHQTANSQFMKRWGLAVLVSILVIIGGCASTKESSPYANVSEKNRDSIKAQELTSRAVECIHDDPEKAEQLLREALAADCWFGPAHNDLGVVLLNKSMLYEAANEFEWARKLMPGHPDPRMNLALTLEKAGRIDEALCTYGTALEVYPGHMPTMQAMTRLQVRHSCVDDHTKSMLSDVAMSGESEEWRSWAQKQMIRLNGRAGS
jgi:Tfp pilus assembly protein PilF